MMSMEIEEKAILRMIEPQGSFCSTGAGAIDDLLGIERTKNRWQGRSKDALLFHPDIEKRS